MKTVERWICIGTQFTTPYYDESTIAYKRTTSIKRLCADSSWNWKKWKSKGWKCIKVSITIQPINQTN